MLFFLSGLIILGSYIKMFQRIGDKFANKEVIQLWAGINIGLTVSFLIWVSVGVVNVIQTIT